MQEGGTLLPTESTTALATSAEETRAVIMEPEVDVAREETPEEEQARVFAKLQEMSGDKEKSDEDESTEEEGSKE
jgi:hypothetical protein